MDDTDANVGETSAGADGSAGAASGEGTDSADGKAGGADHASGAGIITDPDAAADAEAKAIPHPMIAYIKQGNSIVLVNLAEWIISYQVRISFLVGTFCAFHYLDPVSRPSK